MEHNGRGINLGKKNKISANQDFNYEEYEKIMEEKRKTDQKDTSFFFLNELVSEYGYNAVLHSLDKSPSEKNPNDPLDVTIGMLIEKLGGEVLLDNIYFYRDVNIREYINVPSVNDDENPNL